MEEPTKCLITYVVIIVLVIVGALSQPYFEARAFNKFRGEGQVKATYFDAVFSSLRVQSE